MSQPPFILGLDLGTTHCKAGLFATDGAPVALASRAIPVHREANGRATINADALWQAAASTLREVSRGVTPADIACLGVASMAETGLLVDRRTGRPRCPLVPWFDLSASRQAERLVKSVDPFERFVRSGIRLSYKSGVAKILSLIEGDAAGADNAVWLSTADFIVHRLTGEVATDPTLAARTGAYRIDEDDWDREWVDRLGLAPVLFPEVLPGGTVAGEVQGERAVETGLRPNLPVSIGGHDHVVAAFAAGAFRGGIAFDSMGTAESLIGSAPKRRLDRAAYESGLIFGCWSLAGNSGPARPQESAHGGIEPLQFWMGALSASGGSLDWLRRQLGDPPLTYDDLAALLESAPEEPGDLLYFPYLLGAQAPEPDPSARAAFVGLSAGHGRPHMARAMLEGVAFEMEMVRRAAERTIGARVSRIVAAGGGAQVPGWLQIKADMAGYPMHVSSHPEVTVLGAAALAGIGAGVYADPESAASAIDRLPVAVYEPDARRLVRYQRILDHAWLPLQRSLRTASRALADGARQGDMVSAQ